VVTGSGVDADPVDNSSGVGHKRKKVQGPGSGPVDMVIDEVVSSVPSAVSVSHLDEMTFNPSAIFPSESVLSAEDESASAESDEAFVDELFNAFGDDMDIIPDSILSAPVSRSLSPVSVSPAHTSVKEEENMAINTHARSNPNAPDEKMMNNLSDALTLLPKNMQELLVNRLISTITSSDALKSHLDSLDSAVVAEKKEAPAKESPKKCIPIEQNPDLALPLAAATLTALMTQFSVAMKDKKNPVLNKSLPVIPIHA